MKKILIIDEWVPYPLDCGKKIRTYNLLKILSSSFLVTLICYCDKNSHVDKIKEIGVDIVCIKDSRIKKWSIKFYLKIILNVFQKVPFSTVYHVNDDFSESIKKVIDENNPDVVHCEWTNLAPLVDGCNLDKVVISSHNIESDIWYRFARHSVNPVKKIVALCQAKKIEKLERYWYPRVACCTAVTNGDNDVILNYGGRSCVVENGVDVNFYSNHTSCELDDSIVFTASYDTFSNQDAAHHFIDNVWPNVKSKAQCAKVVFVGKCPSERMKSAACKDDSILVTGWVSDVRPYIGSARVCIVPLRIGGGSRLKILEAMAMKKAIVSTTIGAEGLDVTDGLNIILRDDDKQFADEIVDCFFNEKKRNFLSENSFAFVKFNYDWQVIAEKQRKIWMEVAG